MAAASRVEILFNKIKNIFIYNLNIIVVASNKIGD